MTEETAQKCAEALTLVEGGLLQKDAAKRVGFSKSTLSTYVKQGKSKIHKARAKKAAVEVFPIPSHRAHRRSDDGCMSLRVSGSPEQLADFLRHFTGGAHA